MPSRRSTLRCSIGFPPRLRHAGGVAVDRSGIVIVLLVALAASALWCSVLISAAFRIGQTSEPAAWRLVFRPLVSPLLVAGAVLGWAVADPDDCERIGVTVGAAATVAAVVVLRALTRAVRALTARAPILSGTTGILRPVIYVSPELSSALDGRALTALMTHERAHARHRDPARQLIAHFVTDLQWPLPGARRRWIAWRQALEIARDDETLEAGVDGVDLAHAIVTCARLAQHQPCGGAIAHALGEGDVLLSRIERLLSGPTPARSFEARKHTWVHLVAGVVLCFFAGAVMGDHAIEGLLELLP
jgi:hypothetical protein